MSIRINIFFSPSIKKNFANIPANLYLVSIILIHYFMYKVLLHTHSIIITLFLLIYLVKTTLLLLNKKENLAKFSALIKIPEIIISILFLVTGIALLIISGPITFYQIIKLILVFVAIPIAVVGFKKSNKFLAVISLLLIIISFVLGAMNKKLIQKVENSSAIISKPENP